MGFLDLIETVLDKLGDDAPTTGDRVEPFEGDTRHASVHDVKAKSEERDTLAKKLQADMEAFVNKRVAEMVIVVPDDLKDTAKRMLRQFAEECYQKGLDTAAKLMGE